MSTIEFGYLVSNRGGEVGGGGRAAGASGPPGALGSPGMLWAHWGAVGARPRPAHQYVGWSPPQEYAQSRFQLYFQQKGQLTSLHPQS